MKLTPPIENNAVTQAVKHTVATTSQRPGLASKNGFPSVKPIDDKIKKSEMSGKLKKCSLTLRVLKKFESVIKP